MSGARTRSAAFLQQQQQATTGQSMQSPEDGERYKFLENMGSRLKSVYKALDRETGRMVAMKRVRCDGMVPGTAINGEGFHPGSLRELSVLQTLSHPSTVKML